MYLPLSLTTGRVSGPELPAAHPRGDGLRPDLARGRGSDRAALAPDHPREDALQAQRAGRPVRPHGHPLQDAQPGDARAQR